MNVSNMHRASLLAIMLMTVVCPSISYAGRFDVDESAIQAQDEDGREWLSHGRGYSEKRFSPLKKINTENVSKLNLHAFIDIPEGRGQEATPLMSGGVLFTSLSWSRVMAVDAVTGKQLWIYDPKVPKGKAIDACCDVVNRGVALWKGKVYVGALDGRLIALDAKSGEEIWSVQTTDPDQAYTITGAPRVVKGKVIIGNGGGDYGTRGYFSAYDAETGERAWRFFVVPGDPSKPYEHPELEEAAKTWTGDVYWKYGGGGNPWDAIAFDPDLDLLYIGTGNGSPWNREIRSPQGGDNLFLSSILAVRPDSGKLVWYYQETPGDSWDFTATQQITLADINWRGEKRKVILHAPKNGFFYIIDRASGELLSAEKFGKVTWAEKVDLKTGRPVEHPNARYVDKPRVQWPSGFGAHNWHPMSYSPLTGLVYIPYHEVPAALKNNKDNFKYREHRFNTGNGFADAREFPKEAVKGALLAWDPEKQEARWSVPYPAYYNGGTLSTAGNLVFQGTSQGTFVAYSADKGEKLWEFDAQTGIVAGPITYQVNDSQYVAVMAGWGGAAATVGGAASQVEGRWNNSRLLIFKLGGKEGLPAMRYPAPRDYKPVSEMSMNIDASRKPEDIEEGAQIYANNCLVCHGVGAMSGGLMPDLRKSEAAVYDMYDAIILKGAFDSLGMPDFGEYLTEKDVEKIKAYIVHRRLESFAGEKSKSNDQ